MACFRADTTGPVSCGGKAKVTKTMQTKPCKMVFEGMTRENVAREALQVHGLENDYTTQYPFKIWWTGSVYVFNFPNIFVTDLVYSRGGEKKATFIENDTELELCASQLLKKTGKCDVGIMYDIDTMDSFRVRKRVNYCTFNGSIVLMS
jgi:hypothetical protein